MALRRNPDLLNVQQNAHVEIGTRLSEITYRGKILTFDPTRLSPNQRQPWTGQAALYGRAHFTSGQLRAKEIGGRLVA